VTSRQFRRSVRRRLGRVHWLPGPRRRRTPGTCRERRLSHSPSAPPRAVQLLGEQGAMVAPRPVPRRKHQEPL